MVLALALRARQGDRGFGDKNSIQRIKPRACLNSRWQAMAALWRSRSVLNGFLG